MHLTKEGDKISSGTGEYIAGGICQLLEYSSPVSVLEKEIHGRSMSGIKKYLSHTLNMSMFSEKAGCFHL